MVREANPKQIVNLAFEPVRRWPNAGYAVDAGVLAGFCFQPNALVTGNRKQVVDNFEGNVTAVGIVNAGQVRKIIKRRFLVSFQKVADFDDSFAIDVNGKLTDKLRSISDSLSEFRFQLLYERMIGSVSGFRSFFFLLYGRLGCALSSRLGRSEEHTSELQSQSNLVCRLLLEKKKK